MNAARHAGRVRVRAGILARIPALLVALGAGAAAADALDDLHAAVMPFRGIGHADVTAYRVPLDLPDEDEDGAVDLLEVWRAPADYGVRAAGRAAPALVRSWAIFLEPLYVARASALDADLEAAAARLREVARVEDEAGQDGGRRIRITAPATTGAPLPGLLRDLADLQAGLDARGRLVRLRLELRSGGGGAVDTLELACAWDEPAAPQPSRCAWTLPDGGEVRVTTTFRTEKGRRVPAGRQVVFPSRYDPGETEEIRIEYGAYDLDPSADPRKEPGTFRYDTNGLVSE